MELPKKDYLLQYEDRSSIFNLKRVLRIKKNQNGLKEGPNKEIVSREWQEHEFDRRLRIRINRELKANSKPWMVAHHGIYEILKAPLILFITKRHGDTLDVTLRDHSNRGNECIRRKFKLQFHTEVDAKIFQFAHNEMLLEWSKTKPHKEDKKSLIDLTNKNEEDKKSLIDVTNTKQQERGNGKKEDDEVTCLSYEPPQKRRKILKKDFKDVKIKQEEDTFSLTDWENLKAKKEEETLFESIEAEIDKEKAKMQIIFDLGDENNYCDDNAIETQDQWEY